MVQPFLNTFVPGPSSSTPAFVVRPLSGPSINSDAEDPTAHRQKRIRYSPSTRSLQLRNENSDVDFSVDNSDRENQNADDEGGNDEDANDEAPSDDDVILPTVHLESLDNERVRRSGRLNN